LFHVLVEGVFEVAGLYPLLVPRLLPHFLACSLMQDASASMKKTWRETGTSRTHHVPRLASPDWRELLQLLTGFAVRGSEEPISTIGQRPPTRVHLLPFDGLLRTLLPGNQSTVFRRAGRAWALCARLLQEPRYFW